MRFTIVPSRIFSASSRLELEVSFFEASNFFETELISFITSADTDLSCADDLIFETSRFISAISFLACCAVTISCISATFSTIWLSISDLTFPNSFALSTAADEFFCSDIRSDKSFDFSIKFCVEDNNSDQVSLSTLLLLTTPKS